MTLRWHDVQILTGGEIWRRYGVPLLKTRGAEIGGEALRETHARASDATFVDAQGTIRTAGNDVLRLDWSTGVPALLLEPARTNNWTHSEEIDNGNWIKVAANITPNATIAPDGQMTADKMVEFSQSTPSAHGALRLGSNHTASQPVMGSLMFAAAHDYSSINRCGVPLG